MPSWKPENIADLTPELRVLLNEWDPIGVADICPDEYDGLNGLALTELARCGDFEEFCEPFSKAATSFCNDTEEVEAFAVKLFLWFHSKNPDDIEHTRPQLRKGRRWRSSHWKQ